jgi:hypothetical protein
MSLIVNYNLPSPGCERSAAEHIDGVIVPNNAIAGLTATFAGHGPMRQLVLELNAVPITITRDGTTTNGGAGGIRITTLNGVPPLSIVFDHIAYNLTVTGSGGVAAAAVVSTAIGTALPGTIGALSATNAATVQAATAIVTLASSTGQSRTVVTTPTVLNATAGTSSLFLNFGLVEAGLSGNGTLTVTGRVVIGYIPVNN